MIGETFETLYREGATTGRLPVLHLHPWLIGQPFRIGYLDVALRRIVLRQGVCISSVPRIRITACGPQVLATKSCVSSPR